MLGENLRPPDLPHQNVHYLTVWGEESKDRADLNRGNTSKQKLYSMNF